MYKYASLYRVEDPEKSLEFPGKLMRGAGLGLGTLGILHGTRVGVPWAANKLARGILNKPQATLGMKPFFNKVLGHPAVNYAAFTLPLAYSLFSKED